MNAREEILEKVNKLVDAYKQGLLGGEKMPEDENPGLEKSSTQNYMYFTLPMALNYQRNSYVLWDCANRMYNDENANRWEELLEGTDLKPIDVHTPMWLWSRGKFAINIF